MYADVADVDQATGKPRVQINPNSFDGCEVHIALPGERYQEVLVGLTNYQTPPTPGTWSNAERFSAAADGEWTVVTQARPNQGGCLRAVHSPRSWIWIHTSLFESQRNLNVDVCDLVNRAANALLSVLHSGSVPRMSFPAGSLGRLDMCTVLTDAEATAAVDLPGWTAPAARYPAHSCLWKVNVPTTQPALPYPLGIDYNLVSLMTKVGNNPSIPLIPSGKADVSVTIAGRPTVLHAEAPNSCSAMTYGKTWQPWTGHQVYQTRNPLPETTAESVSLSVSLANGTINDACRIAQALAEKAWPRLA